MDMKRELTPEEKSKSYSKYFYMETTPPDKELMAAISAGPISPDKALMPENINDLLNPGYFEVETGWCVLPNGAGYVSVTNKMPGVTVDMVNWWFAWHGLEDLRYMLWFPKGHFGISISEEQKKRVLDSSLDLTQRFQGVTHHVVEDTGCGPENIFISFLSPGDMGFDMSRFKAPDVATLVAGYGFSKPVDAPEEVPPAPAIMCHFIREIPGGIEFRSHFWMGYTIKDKKPVLVLPPGISVPPQVVSGLATHCVEEYTHFREILPKIYKEEKDKPFI